MSIDTIISKYNFSHTSIDKVTVCIMKNDGLKELVHILDCSITEKQAYVIAKAVCEHVFGEDIDVSAPQMTLDRIAIAESEQETIQEKIKRNKEDKARKIIEEDMMLYRLELEFIKKAAEM